MKRFTGDFETRSACDLKKAGAYKYSRDPSTQPTCFAVKIKGKPGIVFLDFDRINLPWVKQPLAFRHWWKDLIGLQYEFSAHNAFFETCIYKNILVKRYGWPDIPFDRFRCTAAKAAACALPRSLEGAGEALNLTSQKDKHGYVAMMATCKPTKQYNAWMKATAEIRAGKRVGKAKINLAAKPCPPRFLEPFAAPAVWEVLYEYCRRDVLAEEALDAALPDLIPSEQEIWFLNQQLNWRGLRVDIPTARKVVAIMEVESRVKLKELDTLTMGLVTKAGARKSILEFLKLEGIELPDIRSKTIDDVLGGFKLNADMRRLLEIRKALSKTSTKKFQGFLDRACEDERVRDILLYHGASTGRDTGTGVQPHNFPRGLVKMSKDRPYATVENVVRYTYADLQLLYGESLPIVFSAILRNMLLASKGYELFVADFSKIEVAVCWWLADNWPGLEVLNSGKDPYKYQAAANTGKTYQEIPDEGDERQLGKGQVLGCQFGMAWEKFQSAAWDLYRLKLTDEQSQDAVKKYREANSAVPELWRAYENAAVNAIERPGLVFGAGKCMFFCARGFLWIELPSKRRLAYRSPRLAWRVREYTAIEVNPATGEKTKVRRTSQPKKTIEFLGLAPSKKTMQWERTWGGTLTENITQAVARDLMMRAIVRLEKFSYRALLTVHDEAICERPIGEGSIEEFEKIMCSRPSWADEHLPIQAKAWSGPRYRK